jgi:hypothetical protein
LLPVQRALEFFLCICYDGFLYPHSNWLFSEYLADRLRFSSFHPAGLETGDLNSSPLLREFEVLHEASHLLHDLQDEFLLSPGRSPSHRLYMVVQITDRL